MGKDNSKSTANKATSLPPTSKRQKIKSSTMKEEISMELAELGNLNPLHEPMTTNSRKKSESEKSYK